MAKIRKLYDEAVKPDGTKQTVYPITSTRAVYTPSNVTMDSLLNEGYRFMGEAHPNTSYPTPNQRAFCLVQTAGTYIFSGVTYNMDSRIRLMSYNGTTWEQTILNSSSSGIAIFDYGISSWDPIVQAHNAGKLVFLHLNNIDYFIDQYVHFYVPLIYVSDTVYSFVGLIDEFQQIFIEFNVDDPVEWHYTVEQVNKSFTVNVPEGKGLGIYYGGPTCLIHIDFPERSFILSFDGYPLEVVGDVRDLEFRKVSGTDEEFVLTTNYEGSFTVHIFPLLNVSYDYKEYFTIENIPSTNPIELESVAYIKPSTGIPSTDLASGVIPDVSNFITNSVNDLVNYYLKSETYTQTEVQSLIGAIQSFHYEIAASTSAVTNPQSNVLYLIGPSGTGLDQYEEYVYPDSTTGWTKIGDTSVDLSQYALKADMPFIKGAGNNSALIPNSNNTAGGASAVAEGQYCIASSARCHAEGEVAIAEAPNAHAEGCRTRASGNQSHTEGYGTQTLNDSEHAEGVFNISHKKTTGTDDEKKAGSTRHSVGIGGNDSDRKNAFEIMQNGDVYIKGVGGYDGTNPATTNIKTLKGVIDSKYEKPANGIPASDIEAGVIPAAQVNSDWNASSGVAEILNKPTIPTVPTNVSAFINDAGYLTSHQDISGKADKVTGAINGNFAGLDTNGNLIDSGKKASDFQETLSSGTNIKTINGSSILGSGNLNIVSSSNVAIVEYGVATFSDISSAINDGKTVLCHYTGSIGNNRYLVESGSVGVVPDVNLLIPIAGIHIGPGTNPSSCVFITTIGVYNNMGDQELISIKLILDAGYDMPGTWNVEITNFITLPS